MAFKSNKQMRSNKYHSNRIDSTADAAVESLFNKRFEIVNNGFRLPDAKTLFTTKPWSLDVLQNLKKELNETKNKLNDYSLTEWSLHTRQRNKAGEVQWRLRKEIQPEFLTQAWCKFYENLSCFPLISEKTINNGRLNSVHLCEAPGAFVTALNHWLKLNAPGINWNWLATTLNPYYEGNSLSRMVNDDRFIMHTLDNWFFGIDNTGNLMDLKNLDALVKKVGPNVMLVTADGSIDCQDTPGEQEEVVSQLHFCETLAALHILCTGASFLLKIFTIFEHQNLCLIYLLSCCFDKIIINKPVTSKEGNSEVYVVCTGFAGPDFIAPYIETLRRSYERPSNMAMFCQSDIPENFINQIVSCGEFLMGHQCEVILSNVRTFRRDAKEYCRDVDMKKIKRMVADRFMTNCKLRPLTSEEMEIVGKKKLAEQYATLLNFRNCVDSYNSRRQRENLNPKQQLSIIEEDLKYVTVPGSGDTFKLGDDPGNLWISTGKPYIKLESSKFCTATILRMYSATLEIAPKVGFNAYIPALENMKGYIQDKEDVEKVAIFEYTNGLDSQKLIANVCKAIAGLEKKCNMTFIGYSLLSQLSVGLLYLLAHTFESLEWRTSEKMGCIITLKRYTANKKVAQYLKEIANASSEAKRKGEAVLSVVPLSTLCDCTFYHDVIKINHWIIKYCVSYIVANFER